MHSAEMAKSLWEHRDAMLRLAMGMLRHRQNAEDAVSAAMVKAFEKAETLRDEKAVKGWLLRITANQCRDDLRRNKRIIPMEEIGAVFAFDGEDGVYAELLALPPKFSEVLILYYYEGFDTAQMAQILRISPAAVRARMTRGRKLLRERLEGNHEEL